MAVVPEQRSKPGRSKADALVGRGMARFVRLVERTSTILTEPHDLRARLRVQHPLVMACWHGQFMMLSCLRPPDVRVAAMVARHRDAELIGAALAEVGVELIRGAGAAGRAKDHGGAYALRASLRALEGGASLVMTADVPPGPARRAGSGIITLARLSGRPIYPVAAASSRFKVFDTWSRVTLNLPFSRLAFVGADPIFVPRDADPQEMERLRVELERRLDTVTARAYALAGADVQRIIPRAAAIRTGLPAPPGVVLEGYRRATSLLRPLAPALLRLRERKGKEEKDRRSERLGIASASRPEGRLVWLHAASVGETNAILPLIEALGARSPALNFLLTTGTVTSAGLARRRLGPRTIHQYVPLDTPSYARAFLAHWRPDLAVFTESEIWPNLILETANAGIPLALVNARMSYRSFKRWKRAAGLLRPLFDRFAIVLAQNETLARRFEQLGARSVATVGNLKIDAPAPPVDARELEALRAALGGRPRIVAASTHEGEEEIVAAAHRLLARRLEGLCTIIAPRHPERGTAIAELLKGQGFSVAQRSLGVGPSPRTEIYLVDTIGELGLFYALAPVALIGGSLIDRGGQNPIEAIRHGAAILSGPHRRNFRDEYDALQRQRAALVVRDAEGLAATACRLLSDERELQAMRAGAEAALASLSGAMQRTVEVLLPFLSDERLKRAS
jgi:3-deoxy-D-manno-octulosonic-acid transferase